MLAVTGLPETVIDAFTHLSVLLSLILGLAITQVLKGYRGLIQGRRQVRLYAPTIIWSVLLLVIFTQSWWTMFALRKVQDWTFLAFAVVLAQTIVEYLLAALVFPDFNGAEPVDLHQHYLDQQRWFFGFAVLAALISLGKTVTITGELPETGNLVFHACFMLACAYAAVARSRVFHVVFSVLMLAAFVGYVGTLFLRLD